MGKKPSRGTRAARWAWGRLRSYPLASVAAVVAIFGGVPAAVYGLSYVRDATEPAWVAQRYWVRDHVGGIIKPIQTAQNSQAVAIDRFLLWQQSEALNKAKQDPLAAQSPTAQDRIKELNDEAKATQLRICKAEGRHNCGS